MSGNMENFIHKQQNNCNYKNNYCWTCISYCWVARHSFDVCRSTGTYFDIISLSLEIYFKNITIIYLYFVIECWVIIIKKILQIVYDSYILNITAWCNRCCLVYCDFPNEITDVYDYKYIHIYINLYLHKWSDCKI